MDKLRTLKMLIAVADLGTLTAAAEHVGASVATVVRQIAVLEAELGVRLLHRTTRSTTPTAEGLQFVQKLRRVLAELQEAEDSLHEGQGSPQGLVNVTAPLSLGQMHVAPSVLQLLQARPKLQVRVTLLDRVVNLVEEGFDVAVRVGRLPDSTLVAQQVGTIRYVVVASPAYLRRAGTPARPEELLQRNGLRFAGPGASPWTFVEGRRSFDVDARGQFECNAVPALLAACADGHGIARVLSYQAEPYLRDGRLKVILAPFETPPEDVSLVYPSALHLSGRVRAVLSWLKADLAARLQAVAAATQP